MKKLTLSIVFISLFATLAYPNNTDTTKISGKPLLRIYSNFHQGITESAHESNFDVKRAYFGYAVNLDNGFSGFVKIDIGSPDDDSKYSLIKRSAYFRNVGVGYKKKKFSIKFGIIDNLQHKTQESFWNKRYLYKSYIDQYKFLPSTDLGINGKYKFSRKIAIEFGIMNGQYLNNDEGIRKYVYNIGMNYNPIEQISLKIHSSYTGNLNDTYTLGAFAGFRINPKIRIGTEYNTIFDMREDDTFITFGYSAFTAYDITEKINVFARYDVLNSNTPESYSAPFNLSKNGTAIIGGIEYRINQNLRASLNYQDWFPMASNSSNSAYIYFNVEFGLFGLSYRQI